MKKTLKAIVEHALRTSRNVGVALVLTAIPIRLDLVSPLVFPTMEKHVLRAAIGDHQVIPPEAIPSVASLTQAVLQQFSIARPDLSPSKIIFLSSSEANAYSLPDGYVILNLGILSRVDTVSQLAGIIGHEIGHRELKSYRDLSAARFVLFGGTLFALGTGGIVVAVAAIPAGFLMERFLQRQQEYAADTYSANLLGQSGFIVSEFGTFLGTKFHAQKYVPPLDDLKELGSTHPIIYKRALRILSQ